MSCVLHALSRAGERPLEGETLKFDSVAGYVADELELLASLAGV